jgi:hypothetical protein
MVFNYVGNKISEYEKDMEYKLQTYNRISGIIKEILINKWLFKHNIIAKAALEYATETWVLYKREKQ